MRSKWLMLMVALALLAACSTPTATPRPIGPTATERPFPTFGPTRTRTLTRTPPTTATQPPTATLVAIAPTETPISIATVAASRHDKTDRDWEARRSACGAYRLKARSIERKCPRFCSRR